MTIRMGLVVLCAVAIGACGDDDPVGEATDGSATDGSATADGGSGDTGAGAAGTDTSGVGTPGAGVGTGTGTGTGTDDGSGATAAGTGTVTGDGTATGTDGIGEEPECLTPAHCADKVDPDACQRAACEDGKCTLAPEPDGAPCALENALVGPCVIGGSCSAGQCTLVEKDCNDGDPCTEDSCDDASGSCVNEAVDGCQSECSTDADCDPTGDPCEANVCQDGSCVLSKDTDGAPCDSPEGDACLVAGACSGGACEGVAKNCDDGLDCTTDSCDAGTGECVHTEGPDGCGDEADCVEDADCTEKLGPLVCKHPVCTDGKCVAETSDDGAGCEEADWVENSCVVGGTCAEGTCVPQTKNCDDQLDCTTDSCDSATGQCVYTSQTQDCGLACDGGDECPDGQYCDTALFGDDLCKPKKIDGTSCGDLEECQSGTCGGCFVNDWCYTVESKSIGDSCLVDEECGSGDCTATCNTPFPQTGVCTCQVDEDCGLDQFCKASLFGDEQCVTKKADCSNCKNNFECASDFCDESFLGTGGKCSTQGASAVGDGCCKDSQCASGICDNAECIGCNDDDDCAEGQSCTNDSCKGLLPVGDPCSDKSQCETGSCQSSECVCVEDAQCGEGFWCDTSFLGQNQCEPLLGECGACGDDNECTSGVCDGLFSPASNKCVTDAVLTVGELCCKDSQCVSDECAKDNNDARVCQCTEDAHCAPGKTCDTSLFGSNVCI